MGQALTWTVVHPATVYGCQQRRGPRATVRCEREIGHPDFHAGRTRRGGWLMWSLDHIWGER